MYYLFTFLKNVYKFAISLPILGFFMKCGEVLIKHVKTLAQICLSIFQKINVALFRIILWFYLICGLIFKQCHVCFRALAIARVLSVLFWLIKYFKLIVSMCNVKRRFFRFKANFCPRIVIMLYLVLRIKQGCIVESYKIKCRLLKFRHYE